MALSHGGQLFGVPGGGAEREFTGVVGQIEAPLGADRFVLGAIDADQPQGQVGELQISLGHVPVHFDALTAGDALNQFLERADMGEAARLNGALARVLRHIHCA